MPQPGRDALRRASPVSGRKPVSFVRLKALAGTMLLAMSASLAQTASEEARALMAKGRYDKAEELLRKVESPGAVELRLLIELANRGGRLAEGAGYARRLLGHYDLGLLRTPQEKAQAAYAAWQLDRWREANDIYLAIAEMEAVPAAVYIDWGNLYLEKYNAAEASEIFGDAIKAAPQDSPPVEALIGMAASIKALSGPGSSQMLDRALEIAPDNLRAIELKSGWAISSESWEEAQEWIGKGLKANPNYLPLLEQLAVLHYFRGNEKEFEKAKRDALLINPNDADLYEALGNMAVNKRRMIEADSFFRQAVELNPRQWTAWAALGVNMLRLGEDEGKRVLERAYENDPFNIWTVNTLRLLDSFENFVDFETEHFRVRLHKTEAAVLRPYVEELLERCLRTLEEKYNHEVSGKYVFEMFPDHEDFAVRTLGMPGLGALGAAFGRIVAMDSPSGRPRGEFHWASTLWHEVAHVVALSLSDQKVPRWFTEGLSMMEERLAMEGWGEHITTTYIQAFRDGELLPLASLNDGFQRPKSPNQIQLSYLQAGWVCEFLASRYGFDKIREMLLTYARDATTGEVFETVLGRSVEAVGEEFNQEMKARLTPLIERLETPEVEGDGERPPDLDAIQAALLGAPDSFFLNLRAGRLLYQQNRHDEAVPYLRKALELFPTYSGSASPYEMLSDIYGKKGMREEKIEVLRKWWAQSAKRAEIAVELAGLLSEAGQLQGAARYLEESLYSDPLRVDSHRDLGDILLKIDRPQDAEREFRSLLALNPTDQAGARFRLARALLENGKRDEAKKEVLLSLEIAPTYSEAQRLLLELVKP